MSDSEKLDLDAEEPMDYSPIGSDRPERASQDKDWRATTAFWAAVAFIAWLIAGNPGA